MQDVVSAVVLCDLLDELPDVPPLSRIPVSGSRAHRPAAAGVLRRLQLHVEP